MNTQNPNPTAESAATNAQSHPAAAGAAPTEGQPTPQAKSLLEQAIAATKQDVLCNESGALVPRSLEQMWRLAKYVHASGLAPKSFKTLEQVFVAFAYGGELGVSPMMSLQFFAVVNGKVSLYGDAQVALAMSVVEYLREWFEDESGEIDQSKPGWSVRINKAIANKTLVAVAEGKRKDKPEVHREFFSIVDAERAGLLGKEGPWRNYPQRMMRWRPRGWLLRYLAAERFGGLKSVEEQLDNDDELESRPAPSTKPAQARDLGDRIAAKAGALRPADKTPDSDETTAEPVKAAS